MSVALPIVSLAPTGAIDAYDRAHATVYLRLLDAEAAGADWHEVVKIVLGLNGQVAEKRARVIYDSHLSRAKWLRDGGYAELLAGPSEEAE